MDEEIARELQANLRAVVRQLRRDVPPVEGVSRSAVRVLGVVARDAGGHGVQPGAIADELVMTTSNVAAALRELVATGLAVRQRSDDDGRRVTVALTESGAEAVSAHRALRTSGLRERIEASLTLDEQRRLAGLVPLLAKLAAGPGSSS